MRARFVFPQADGNAAAIYFVSPSGLVTAIINMCSEGEKLKERKKTEKGRGNKPAIHPSSLPKMEAILSARHFYLKKKK